MVIGYTFKLWVRWKKCEALSQRKLMIYLCASRIENVLELVNANLLTTRSSLFSNTCSMIEQWCIFQQKISEWIHRLFYTEQTENGTSTSCISPRAAIEVQVVFKDVVKVVDVDIMEQYQYILINEILSKLSVYFIPSCNPLCTGLSTLPYGRFQILLLH